jgi:ribosomal protein S18 acetylase RimI-like enzyme
MDDSARQRGFDGAPTSQGLLRPSLSTCRLRDEVLATDREAVRALVARTGFFRADEVDVAVELVDERLARGTASGYHFVFAEVDKTVAGYACYGPIACTTASFDLYWMAVDPQFQGQGIGRLLMAAVEARIREAGGQRIYIDTSGRSQYAPTRAYYEDHGFCCEARLRDFYAPGDDRLIYAKELCVR